MLEELIHAYIKSIEKDLPPEIVSKEIEVLENFLKWNKNNNLEGYFYER